MAWHCLNRRGPLHKEPCNVYSRLPKDNVIFAVVPERRHVFAFNTGVQSFVEDFMHDVGYGSPDYYLCSPYRGLLLPRGTSLWENKGNVDPNGYGKGKPAMLHGRGKKIGYSLTKVNVNIFAGTKMGKMGSEWQCRGFQCELPARKCGRGK